MIDPTTWPEVPNDARPKTLYVNLVLDETAKQGLNDKGWIVSDVRLMPSTTDAQRLDVVKAYLEGIRMGSIDTSRDLKEFLDLELYVLGIKGKVQKANDKGALPQDDVDTLLTIGSTRMSGEFTDKLKGLKETEKEVKKPKGKKVKEGK